MLVARAKSFEAFMAVIEIPNAYTSDMAISTPGSERFVMVGTPIVAVEIIHTVAAPGSPAAEDLLSADRDAEAWWRIEGTRAPRQRHSGHPRPAPAARDLRETIEALVDRRPVPPAAVSDLNFFMRPAPVSTRLLPAGTGLGTQTQWH
jgi:hypothetical protein